MHHPNNKDSKHGTSICLDGNGVLAPSSSTAATTTTSDGDEDEDSPADGLEPPLFR
jgi:hypothetical protein